MVFCVWLGWWLLRRGVSEGCEGCEGWEGSSVVREGVIVSVRF